MVVNPKIPYRHFLYLAEMARVIPRIEAIDTSVERHPSLQLEQLPKKWRR